MMFAADFTDKDRIAFLDMSGIHQHYIDQVGSGQSAMDIAFESFFYQIGDIADMVDMGMRKNQGIDGCRIKGKIQVTLIGIFTSALI